MTLNTVESNAILKSLKYRYKGKCRYEVVLHYSAVGDNKNKSSLHVWSSSRNLPKGQYLDLHIYVDTRIGSSSLDLVVTGNVGGKRFPPDTPFRIPLCDVDCFERLDAVIGVS